VKTRRIHRFLWSRLAKSPNVQIVGNEPRPEGAVDPAFSHRLVSEGRVSIERRRLQSVFAKLDLKAGAVRLEGACRNSFYP
jgi:hypothetical protein